MEQHNISLETKYFEPIRNGEITLLIFDRKQISPEAGDCIEARKGQYSVKAIVVDSYIKTFSEITEREARAAGFVSKDFLKDELIRRFNIDTLDYLLNTIDDYMFFLIEVSQNYKVKKINTTDTNFDNFIESIRETNSNLYETTSELYDVWRY